MKNPEANFQLPLASKFQVYFLMRFSRGGIFTQLVTPTSVTSARPCEAKLVANKAEDTAVALKQLCSDGELREGDTKARTHCSEFSSTTTTTGHLIILYAKSICFPAAQTGWEQAAKPNEGKCLRGRFHEYGIHCLAFTQSRRSHWMREVQNRKKKTKKKKHSSGWIFFNMQPGWIRANVLFWIWRCHTS